MFRIIQIIGHGARELKRRCSIHGVVQYDYAPFYSVYSYTSHAVLKKCSREIEKISMYPQLVSLNRDNIYDRGPCPESNTPKGNNIHQ